MRRVLSLIAGSLLTLVLFALLALLVVPPQAEPELREEITLTLAEAPAPEAETPSEAAPSSAPPPPPPTASAPPPPSPAPTVDSEIALPEPEMPAMDMPELAMDSRLPELTETPPEPEPQPEPEPEPQPEPQPAPRPTPSPSPAPSPSPSPSPAPSPSPSPSPAAASGSAASQAAPASNTPVDVGTSARATSKVPPQYPSRAQRRGLEGYVIVQFLIRADGSVDRGSIEVLEASPRRTFERAATDAIAGWRFESASGLRRARQRLEFQLK
ncbi:energy transducer TonB [Halomonas sp. V046]|uniref:energy transducer TonB n=1 Tax=Halomonas sp. V046 TaxID=3459611 RepID=UPI00404511D6